MLKIRISGFIFKLFMNCQRLLNIMSAIEKLTLFKAKQLARLVHHKQSLSELTLDDNIYCDMPWLVHIMLPHRLHKLQSSLLSETIYNLLTVDCRLHSKHAEAPSIPFTYVYIMFLFLLLTPSHLFSFLFFSLLFLSPLQGMRMSGESTEIMHLTQLERESAGAYACGATNTEGETRSSSLTLRVQCK